MKITVAVISLLFQISTVFNVASCASVSSWTVVSENGSIEIIDESTTIEDSDSTLTELKKDVLFYLYTSSNTEDADQLYLEDDTVLSASYFNVKNPTRIVIHGWQNSAASTISTTIRNAYLKEGDYNVILVDWNSYARKNYLYACTKIVTVGEYIGLLIDYLVNKGGMDIADLLVVGHSLGAHVAGISGRSAVDDVPIVVGLDPAGPLFYGSDVSARLRSTDGDFVQVIHTSAGWLGYKGDLGDVDFWVNGGSKQPGCGLDVFRTCAHGRSYYYFAESLTDTDIQFTAHKSASYAAYELKDYTSTTTTYLGGIDIDTTASGDYYLNTNSASIYAQG